jgi:hypothetical protein
MKIALMTLALLVPAVAAQAQPQAQPQQQQNQQDGRVRGVGNMGTSRTTAEDIQKYRDTEKAYNETIKHIPVQKPADPWGKMR